MSHESKPDDAESAHPTIATERTRIGAKHGGIAWERPLSSRRIKKHRRGDDTPPFNDESAALIIGMMGEAWQRRQSDRASADAARAAAKNSDALFVARKQQMAIDEEKRAHDENWKFAFLELFQRQYREKNVAQCISMIETLQRRAPPGVEFGSAVTFSLMTREENIIQLTCAIEHKQMVVGQHGHKYKPSKQPLSRGGYLQGGEGIGKTMMDTEGRLWFMKRVHNTLENAITAEELKRTVECEQAIGRDAFYVIREENGRSKKYVISEYLGDKNLADVTQYSDDNTILYKPPAERLSIFIDIVRQMNVLHEKNILHRDLKLANVVFDTNTNRVSIVDFTLSEPCSNSVEKVSSSTLSFFTKENFALYAANKHENHFGVDHHALANIMGSMFPELFEKVADGAAKRLDGHVIERVVCRVKPDALTSKDPVTKQCLQLFHALEATEHMPSLGLRVEASQAAYARLQVISAPGYKPPAPPTHPILSAAKALSNPAIADTDKQCLRDILRIYAFAKRSADLRADVGNAQAKTASFQSIAKHCELLMSSIGSMGDREELNNSVLLEQACALDAALAKTCATQTGIKIKEPSSWKSYARGEASKEGKRVEAPTYESPALKAQNNMHVSGGRGETAKLSGELPTLDAAKLIVEKPHTAPSEDASARASAPAGGTDAFRDACRGIAPEAPEARLRIDSDCSESSDDRPTNGTG